MTHVISMSSFGLFKQVQKSRKERVLSQKRTSLFLKTGVVLTPDPSVQPSPGSVQ